MVWKAFGRNASKNGSDEAAFDIDAYIEEMLGMQGEDERPDTLPSWSIRFVPTDDSTDFRSFIGGKPILPAQFAWPVDSEMNAFNFLAQIDLSDLRKDNADHLLARGLPEEGVLAFFVGSGSKCFIFSPSGMENARTHDTPPNVQPMCDRFGFFNGKSEFPRWNIALKAFSSRKEATNDVVPGTAPQETLGWLSNWGIVRVTAERLSSYARSSKIGTERYNEIDETLQRWLRSAERNADIKELTSEEKSLVSSHFLNIASDVVPMLSSTTPAAKLSHVFQYILDMSFGLQSCGGDFRRMPSYLDDYLKKWVRTNRGHRLLGHEGEIINLDQDLRGYDCLLSIASDSLLNTASEHHAGFSIWAQRKELDAGLLENLKLVMHHNG